MGPTPRPVDPREAPVRQQMRGRDAQHCREVVLVHVAGRPAELLERGVVRGVGDDVHGQFPVDLEPLGPFAPVGEVDQGRHVAVVAPSAVGAGLVERAHEAGPGSGDVAVDDAEALEGDAGL